MESLNSLYRELDDLQNQLNKITIKSYTKPVYDYERGDVPNEESQEIKDYTDPEKARYLQERIEKVTDRIRNYAMYVQMEKEREETQKKLEKEAYEKTVSIKAKELYEKELDSYHKKGLFGKIGILFNGKKPKSKLSDKEINEIYSKQAASDMERTGIEAEIADLRKEQKAHIDYLKAHPSETNQKLIDYYQYYFDTEISKLQEQLNSKGISR